MEYFFHFIKAFINGTGIIMWISAFLGFIIVWIGVDKGEKFIAFIAGLGGFVVGMILTLFALIFVPSVTNKTEIPIVSLYNLSSISGSFMIGSGTIDNIEYYFYYEKYGKNCYIRGKTRVHNTFIVETNEESPKFSYQKKNKIQNIWTGILGNEFREILNKKLIVPEGTIIREFSLK